MQSSIRADGGEHGEANVFDEFVDFGERGGAIRAVGIVWHHILLHAQMPEGLPALLGECGPRAHRFYCGETSVPKTFARRKENHLQTKRNLHNRQHISQDLKDKHGDRSQ